MTVPEPLAGGADRRPQGGHDDGFGHGFSPIRRAGTRVARGEVRMIFSQIESMNCKKGNSYANQR
jgi:hypothetical protein